MGHSIAAVRETLKSRLFATAGGKGTPPRNPTPETRGKHGPETTCAATATWHAWQPRRIGHNPIQKGPRVRISLWDSLMSGRVPGYNTKGYSSTYLAMGFANVRAGTQKRRGVISGCWERASLRRAHRQRPTPQPSGGRRGGRREGTARASRMDIPMPTPTPGLSASCSSSSDPSSRTCSRS